ncbi:MAG TPA: CopD family protein [Longimicrobiales bacterium]|nr:CopD family protein [Longimicrobiales bacterium]
MNVSLASTPLATLVDFLWFAQLLAAVGATVFHLRVLAAGRAVGTSERALDAASGRALSVLRVVAVALVVLIPLRLAGAPEAGDGPAGWAASPWGAAWLLQVAATLLLVAGAVRARPRGRRGWRLAAAGAALLCVVPALSGHAMEAEMLRPVAVVSDALHVFASGAWLGSLAVLLLALGPVARATPDGRLDGARLARVFSPVALAGAATVVATGLVRALFHVGSAAELWRTVYGNTLTFKVGIAGVVLVAGLYNWRRTLPRLGTRRGEDALRRTATLELVVATLVLLLTAVLVGLPLP